MSLRRWGELNNCDMFVNVESQHEKVGGMPWITVGKTSNSNETLVTNNYFSCFSSSQLLNGAVKILNQYI